MQVLHCLNELNLRNGWRDDDRFSIRLARRIAKTALLEDNIQFLNQIKRVRTNFFRCNRVLKKRYSEYAWPYVAQVLQSWENQYGSQIIRSEQSLFQVVVDLLIEYKTEIESTRLWHPFWNEENGKPKTPKKELSLQPTIHTTLRRRFHQRGIEFLREPDDGVGPLDFRCTATNGKNVFNCCIEFKRAQHSQLEHKIQAQLPAYMNAADSKHGVFFVFWFKDGTIFNEPAKYTSPDVLRSSLVNAAQSVTNKNIEVIIVDVTQKPSASKR